MPYQVLLDSLGDIRMQCCKTENMATMSNGAVIQALTSMRFYTDVFLFACSLE